MKKLCCLTVAAVLSLIAVPAVAPTAVEAAVPAAHHHETIELFFGPYRYEYHANEKADDLRDHVFHAEVYYVESRGWHIRAWKHE